jgi:hypothetical protein
VQQLRLMLGIRVHCISRHAQLPYRDEDAFGAATIGIFENPVQHSLAVGSSPYLLRMVLSTRSMPTQSGGDFIPYPLSSTAKLISSGCKKSPGHTPATGIQVQIQCHRQLMSTQGAR